jgi:hypothetical protein
MDPEEPVPGAGDGLTMDRLPAQAIDAFVGAAGPGAPFLLLSAEVRQLGGEFSRRRPGNGALAALDAQYVLYAVGITPVPGLAAPVMAQVEAIKQALAPWAASQMYLNFAETQHSAAPFWTEQAYQRLCRARGHRWRWCTRPVRHPARAIGCAQSLRDGARTLGLPIRAGVHPGDMAHGPAGEVRSIAVHTGARVAALAGAGEILVSRTIRDLVAGAPVQLESRGVHELKGVPGSWEIFAVAT